MEAYDAIVVGAGLAGLQCAKLLAGQGAAVLLVDRKQRLADRIHTTGIFVRRTLDDFQIPESCLGPGIRHVVLYSPAGRSLPLASGKTEFRVGRMGRLYEQTLETAVDRGAVWRPATSFLGCERIASESSDASHPLRVSLETGETVRRVAARFLIGADGTRSQVASTLGLSQNRHWIVGLEKVYRLPGGSRPATLHCFLDPRLAPGYLAWVADDGCEAHVGVGGYAGRFRPREALEEFIATSARKALDFAAAEPLEQRGGRIPVGGLLERIVSPQGMLVGDASGAVSPLTAGGLDPCLRLSALAAQVAGEYLRSGDPSVLKAYDANRFRGKFRSRRLLRRLLPTLRSRWMAEAACGLLRTPPLRRWAESVFFGRGSFPIERCELAPILGRSPSEPSGRSEAAFDASEPSDASAGAEKARRTEPSRQTEPAPPTEPNEHTGPIESTGPWSDQSAIP